MSTSLPAMESLFMETLPVEIRLLIYRELLGEPAHYLEPQGKDPDNEPYTSNVYPALLGVCKQIYTEASAVLYEENTFGYQFRNECIMDDGKNLYLDNNQPRGSFNRIKHVQISYTTKRETHLCHIACKLTAVVEHLANLGCALKTLFLNLQFRAEDEILGAAARIVQAKYSHGLIKVLAALNVNQKIHIILESDQVTDCKVFEDFANEIGLLKVWAVNLTTRTSIPRKECPENDQESDEEESDEGESDGEKSDDEGVESGRDELSGAIDQIDHHQEQDANVVSINDNSAHVEKYGEDERILLPYQKEHENLDTARFIWIWTIKPATTSTKKDVPTNSRYGESHSARGLML